MRANRPAISGVSVAVVIRRIIADKALAGRATERTTMPYDLVIVGLGAMGSAVLDDAARRGLRVLGVEQFAAGHPFGSSHGKSRMIRKAYFEDPAYVPMLLRAYELWADLERRSGCHLLTTTGVLQVGAATRPVVRGVQESARLHDLS